MHKTEMHLHSPARLSLLFLGLCSFAHAAAEPFEPTRECKIVFAASHATQPGVSLGNIDRADLANSVLLGDAPVKNQRKYGCCWISSDLARWERDIEKKFKKSIPLSQDYLAMASLYYRIEEAVHYGQPITPGGWSDVADWMATRIGLVPESAWQPAADFRSPGASDELLGYLNGEVAKLQSKLKKLSQSGGDRFRNEEGQLVSKKERAWELAQSTKARLWGHLRTRYGKMPARFEVDGVSYTPHSFAASILPEDSRWRTTVMTPIEPRVAPQAGNDADADLVQSSRGLFKLFPDTRDFLPVTKDKLKNPAATEARAAGGALKRRGREIDLNAYRLYFRGRARLEEKRPLSEIKRKILESLADGDPVFIGTPMVKDYYKREVGVMSLSANGADLEKAKKAKYTGGHAMLITGVYRDEKGEIVGFRIQNSWGETNGELGYFYMDVDYFDAFVRRLTFKRRIPKSSAEEAIE